LEDDAPKPTFHGIALLVLEVKVEEGDSGRVSAVFGESLVMKKCVNDGGAIHLLLLAPVEQQWQTLHLSTLFPVPAVFK
jgi:hypothetical protein